MAGQGEVVIVAMLLSKSGGTYGVVVCFYYVMSTSEFKLNDLN